MDKKPPDALRMAEALEADELPAWPSRMSVAEELRRLHTENEFIRSSFDCLKSAFDEWNEKTEWVQKSARVKELGKHRADVLRERIADLESQLTDARQGVARLQEKNLELDRLCDTTYVAQGADAYQHACDMMEQHQARRDAAGKDVGAEGSLCDGIAWLYGRIADLEDQLEAVGAGGVGPMMAAPAQTTPAEADVQNLIDSAPEPFRRLGNFLASALDEDLWETANQLLIGGLVAISAVPQPAAQAAPVDADTWRLNWLEQHSDGYYNIDRVSAIVGSGFFTGPFTIKQKKHETLRAAIDAVRAAQGGA